MGRGLSAALVAGAVFVIASPAIAAPPVLTSVSHVDRHPAATWTLPPGVKSQIAEVATSPATSTDGYFFRENVKAFDLLEEAQTNWVYNLQLDPGVYYLHVAGLDEPCFFAGLCPVREFTQTATLLIEAPPPAASSSAATAAVRGERPLDPPRRDQGQGQLDLLRRHRPRPLPQRERAPRRRAGLPRLLHA